MDAVLNRPITNVSEVEEVLEFWKLCVLNQKMTNDYESSDYLIIKSLEFMKSI